MESAFVWPVAWVVILDAAERTREEEECSLETVESAHQV